jgi:predicted GH43/DUF377 family glycosyl hydrolase
MNKIDIYNADVFEIENFHVIENENDSIFRWTDGHFKIKPKQKVNNVCINFVCIGNTKKIFIFLQNKIKNIKIQKDLQAGQEYILCIPAENIDEISFIVSPNVKASDEEFRTLGLYVKKIYTSILNIEYIDLISNKQANFNQYLQDSELCINKDIELCINKDIELIDKSLFEQNLNIEIVKLDYNRKNFEFNSCLFTFKNKKYLITRKSRFVTSLITENCLKLYEYDTLKEICLDIKEEYDFEQFEDPRVLIHENKIYISCATYSHDKFSLIHQKMIVLDENFNHIKNIHFKYGLNGKSIEENIGVEKNWTFFIHENRLMCIYKIDPHIVVEFDWNGNVTGEYVSYEKVQNKWPYGICRGGTNPIYKEGLYHSFFHSSIYWKGNKRKYVMGKYAFESKPPFRICFFDEKPIIWGNSIDQRINSKLNPLVVFPCGAILENNRFIVSFGINDEKTGIIKL